MFQELVIQQLQDEILNIRKGGNQGSGTKGSNQGSGTNDAVTNDNAAIQELKNKLKLAAKHIAQLARERQQLIEMGNKMRAELNKAGL